VLCFLIGHHLLSSENWLTFRLPTPLMADSHAVVWWEFAWLDTRSFARAVACCVTLLKLIWADNHLVKIIIWAADYLCMVCLPYFPNSSATLLQSWRVIRLDAVVIPCYRFNDWFNPSRRKSQRSTCETTENPDKAAFVAKLKRTMAKKAGWIYEPKTMSCCSISSTIPKTILKDCYPRPTRNIVVVETCMADWSLVFMIHQFLRSQVRFEKRYVQSR
jgi:hypothetical protein